MMLPFRNEFARTRPTMMKHAASHHTLDSPGSLAYPLCARADSDRGASAAVAGETLRANDSVGANASAGGTLTCVSAVCPHMGGILQWNDLERSWDCPLHGSRFQSDGARIEGPAVDNLQAK